MVGDYFFTISAREQTAAVDRYGCVNLTALGYIYFVQVPGTAPLYRLRNSTGGLHLYTTAADERDTALGQAGYQDEGVAGFVLTGPQPGAVPVFRLSSPADGGFFYTTSPTERDHLLDPAAIPAGPSSPGVSGVHFVDQGTAFYVFENQAPNTVPLRRLYQPPDSPPIPRRIRGFADLHNHQFANLGFGGLAFVGSPYGVIQKSLRRCDNLQVHGPDGTLDLLGGIRNLMEAAGGIGHPVGGYPNFNGWPRWNNLTHQAVYQDWLKRALDGGLKLLVMLAVNSEMVANIVNRAPGRTADDMEAVDLQIKACYQMQAYIDKQSGGAGKGWYRIVKSPQEARTVIEAGKLAVVLGIEVDNVFGCKAESPLSPLQILNVLDRYYEMGVRHVFPIHFSDNAFGGTGFQNIMVGDPAVVEPFNPADPASLLNDILGVTGWPSEITTRPETTAGYTYRGGRVNIFGLTDLGKFLIQAMMSKGMLIDTDHMSSAAWADVLTLAETHHYPTVSSHTGFIDIGLKDKRHEGNMRGDQAERIHHNGGMIACILNQGNLDEVKTWRGIHQTVVEHRCGSSAETWAQAYLYATEKTGGEPVGFGTDFNGMIHPPGPRFGPDGCHGGRAPDGLADPHPPVQYPITALATGVSLTQSMVERKTFDINTDGLAHIGLLPDFIADLQQLGLTPADLDPLLSSAEGYIQMWEQAEQHKPEIASIAVANGPWWVQVGGGFFKTQDKDLINFIIEPGAVAADSVEFVVELYESLTWRKEIQLAVDHQTVMMAVNRLKRTDRCTFGLANLTGARLHFRKDKGPGEPLIFMEPCFELDGLATLPGGSRVTFRWIRDR